MCFDGYLSNSRWGFGVGFFGIKSYKTVNKAFSSLEKGENLKLEVSYENVVHTYSSMLYHLNYVPYQNHVVANIGFNFNLPRVFIKPFLGVSLGVGYIDNDKIPESEVSATGESFLPVFSLRAGGVLFDNHRQSFRVQFPYTLVINRPQLTSWGIQISVEFSSAMSHVKKWIP